MINQEPAVAFDQERASLHERRFARLAPLRDALHLCIRAILCELPVEAHVLLVGVGTGPELIYLAHAFPQWRFTAVEPAAPMLAICRQRAEEAGITPRCTFHEGYLDSLADGEPFDAATCLLVSQFLVSKDERSTLFRQIAARLRPEGWLVSADLVSLLPTPEYRGLFDVWLRMLRYSEMPVEEIDKMQVSYGRDFAALPVREVESLIASSGFEMPVLFLQTLLIHAWYARRAPSNE